MEQKLMKEFKREQVGIYTDFGGSKKEEEMI